MVHSLHVFRTAKQYEEKKDSFAINYQHVQVSINCKHNILLITKPLNDLIELALFIIISSFYHSIILPLA